MSRIKCDQFMITYDNELGIVYAPMKGTVKTTTPIHAQAIENCLNQYLNNEMNEQDMLDFEDYMHKYFGNIKDIPKAEYQNLKERDVLRRLEIIIANDCNLRCRYCYAHGGTYGMKIQRLTPENAYMYLNELLLGKYRYVNIVTFFGGEPTLCPSTIEAICEYFSENVSKGLIEKMPIFLMVTNGTLLDDKMVEIIHKFNMGITISIDGPSDINDLLRVDTIGNGTYSKISQGIELLKQVGTPPVLLEATYTTKHKEMGYSKEDIQEFLIEQFNIKKVMVADCCSGGIDESLVHVDWDAHIKENGEELFSDISHTYDCLTKEEFLDIGCDVGYGTIALMPNGELYPCHFFINHSDYRIAYYYNGRFDFSNYENVLRKFGNICKSQNIRCTNCWAKVVCQFCPAQQLLESDEECIEADCSTRKTVEKNLILKCAKASLIRI